jgi:fatty acid desaturase
MMLGCAGHASVGGGVDGVMPVRVVAFVALLLVTGVIMHFMFHGSSSKKRLSSRSPACRKRCATCDVYPFSLA